METARKSVEQTQHLTFIIAGQEYAVGILRVREIIQYDGITRVPRMPPWISGVINLRGGVVPVVDLAVRFGLSETAITDTTCIIITEVELGGDEMVLGVLADSVSQVIELSQEDIEPPPAFGTSVHADFLLGMGKAGKGFVLMLDIDKVLSSEELLETASAAGDDAEEAPAAGPGGGADGEGQVAAST